jgi:hypothetical protein
MSVSDLARLLCVSRPYLSKVIHEENYNTPLRQSIAKALECELRELWPEDSDEKK